MRTHRLAIVAGFLLALGAACYRGSGSSTPGHGTGVLRAPEIAAAGVTTAYDAVERLRPHFLRGRGASSIQNPSTSPVVYMDDIRLGSVSSLRQISAVTVREIHFISARDATTRWGTGHSNGVILVLTNRG